MSPRRSTTALLLGALGAAFLGPRAGLAADGDDGARAPIAGAVDVALAPLRIAPHEQVSMDLRPPSFPPPVSQADRGVRTRVSVAVPILESLAIDAIMLEWSRYVGEAKWANTTAGSIGRNLRGPWVLDTDAFWINQFGHPYQGTWSHTATRSSGFGFWASVPITFGASWAWEIAGETTPPSLNDQVTTTVAGLALGEVLYRFAGMLRAEGGGWRRAFATLLDPMGAINGRAFGTPQALPAPDSRWQLALGGAAFTASGSAGRGELLPYGGLAFTYGMPGDPGLELEHPFDHFVLDLDWTASADPAAAVRARGLLAGATFGADRGRGLYGAFLSFEMATPPGYRISTSAIGFGGSGSADLGRGLALEWDAIASAVLLGAAGTMQPDPLGAGRDYEFGPGEQSLLAVRVLAGSRARAGISVRQYLLVGGDGNGGTELLLHGTANASLRVVGPHGIGVELNRYLRRAEGAGESVRQADSALRIYYVLHGGA
jgi:hypothetical protein